MYNASDDWDKDSAERKFDQLAGQPVNFVWYSDYGFDGTLKITSASGDDVPYEYVTDDKDFGTCWLCIMPAEPITIETVGTEKTTFAGRAFVGNYKGFPISVGTNGVLQSAEPTFSLNLAANSSFHATVSGEKTFGGCYTFNDATNRFSYDDAYSADVWGRRTYGVSGKWFEGGVVKMKPTTGSEMTFLVDLTTMKYSTSAAAEWDGAENFAAPVNGTYDSNTMSMGMFALQFNHNYAGKEAKGSMKVQVTLTSDMYETKEIISGTASYTYDATAKQITVSGVLAGTADGRSTERVSIVFNVNADSKPTLTLTVSTDGTEMSFNGWDSNIAAPLYVYDAGGRSVLHCEAWRGETVSISALAKGVYVVKAGEHTAKFRK
ncbi:MAG: hypothetical protein MSB00_03600 [Prevotella sp.]|nr:hypothetical protein [Prevotella sp.]